MKTLVAWLKISGPVKNFAKILSTSKTKRTQPAHSGQPESSAAAPISLQCSAIRTSLEKTLTTALQQPVSALRPTWFISSCTKQPPVFCQQDQLAVQHHYCPPAYSGQPESSAAAPNSLQCSAIRTSLQLTLTTALQKPATALRPI